jgi:hypothetical protein
MMRNGPPASYAYFGLHGDFNPFEFARRIALQPHQCIDMHSRNPLRKLPRTSILDYAQFETAAPIVDIDDLSQKVVTILEPHQEALASAITNSGATATLQVVLYFPVSEDVSTPILIFSQRVIRFLAAVNASIDIDSYRWSE